MHFGPAYVRFARVFNILITIMIIIIMFFYYTCNTSCDVNMSDPHVDDKNTDRYDNTYNRSCDVNMFGPHVQGRVGMRKNVCTEACLVTISDEHFSYAEARGPEATAQVT